VRRHRTVKGVMSLPLTGWFPGIECGFRHVHPPSRALGFSRRTGIGIDRVQAAARSLGAARRAPRSLRAKMHEQRADSIQTTKSLHCPGTPEIGRDLLALSCSSILALSTC